MGKKKTTPKTPAKQSNSAPRAPRTSSAGASAASGSAAAKKNAAADKAHGERWVSEDMQNFMMYPEGMPPLELVATCTQAASAQVGDSSHSSLVFETLVVASRA